MHDYGVPFSLEFRYRPTSEREVWACSQAMELRDGHGRLVGYLGTATEITEVRRMREEVQRCRVELETRVRGQMIQWEQMALIVASSSDADHRLRYVRENRQLELQAAERIFGYLADYMIGRTLVISRLRIDGRRSRRSNSGFVRGSGWIIETVRVASDGSPIEVAMSVFPLEDPGGPV